jgi:hypothetical protein
MKRVAVMFLGIASFLNRFKRKAKDGPVCGGSGEMAGWDSFSVSRSDSYAEHNFQITVKYKSGGYIVKGTFLGYEEEKSVVLPKSACQKIDELQPQSLPNVVRNSVEDDFFDEVIILDAPEVNVEVAYTNGTLLRKVDENDFSIRVYQIVWPYFVKKYHK